MQFSTMADIALLLNANLNSDNEELRKHASTLVGPRKHGSTTGYGLDAIPTDRQLRRYYNTDTVADNVQCYTVQSGELQGRIGAISFADICVRYPLATVEEREGIHGTELFSNLRQYHPEHLPRTEIVSFIIGQHGDELALFTWHPGLPLLPYKGEKLPFVAVKLV